MDILTAAEEGSLKGVCDALEAGVLVDTTDRVWYTYLLHLLEVVLESVE